MLDAITFWKNNFLTMMTVAIMLFTYCWSKVDYK